MLFRILVGIVTFHSLVSLTRAAVYVAVGFEQGTLISVHVVASTISVEALGHC